MSEDVIRDFFICVGAQKAGTTWLARILAGHPDVFITPVKEIHYFDYVRDLTQHLSEQKRASRHRKYHQRLWTQWHKFAFHRGQWAWYRDYMKRPIDDAWYASLFKDRGGKRFAGEATPEYAIIGKEGYEHIKRLSPGVRILFILRNPVTRAWSQALHHCRATDMDAARMSRDQLIEHMEGAPHFNELGAYMETIVNLEAVFAPEQLKLMFYETIHNDRQAGLAEICRFIGAGFSPAMFPELTRKFNTSQDVKLPDDVRQHLRAKFEPLAKRVKEKLGGVPESWEREFEF